jgi:hypothetical protein
MEFDARSGVEVTSAELISGTDLGGRMECGRGGRHGESGESIESMPFSSLTSLSLPISLCSLVLAPTRGGGRHGQECATRDVGGGM